MRKLPLRQVVVTTALAGIPGLVGCQRALFPEAAPRTQFESHERVRNRYTPLVVPDVFGQPQPALRARLAQN